ncbi:hypothetical protein PAXRUDRAFT_16518 [Paxillus rubicundulus Ve08.2h10]|uniref:SH3 domain-containing protein n=1 Tax=Paxillus rubicundulus Ve08.2h10 TaxID=930991 RepID=A0A0D0DE44_9AGAM|nr:hypothetical protein PAXRUDRAFT_16518 [Paxillus rubicundulus Ve08.2h10]
MPPRGNEGLDFTPILTHYLFLFTTVLAVLAWFIAFISQAIATAQSGNVGVSWFGIFLQLFLILGVIHTLATDSIAMHRFQISTFGAIAIVFAVLSVNQSIFSGRAALDAMASGWLILAIVDILWVLYFTSEEDSLVLHLFNSLGTGGLTPPSRRRRTRGPSVHNMGTNGYATNYASGGGIGSHDMPYDSAGKMGGGIGAAGVRSQNSFVGGGSTDGAAPRSLGPAVGAGSVHSTPIAASGPLVGPDTTMGAGSPLMGAGAAGVGAGGGLNAANSPTPEPAPEQESYIYKAKALYAYTASPDDPNEISFTKGEILDIVDKQGKWWQAKKVDGNVGIAPSNYLQII